MKKKINIFLISFALLIGIAVSVTDVFSPFERNLISWYLKNKRIGKSKIVVVTVDKKSFSENKLWPWASDWPKYLISFILDLKPEKLILGSYFTKEIKNLNSYSNILKNKRLLMPFNKKPTENTALSLSDSIQQKRGFFYGSNKYGSLSKTSKKGFYFLPQTDNVKVISASNIALAGFLRNEGYESQDLKLLRSGIVFLEGDVESLNKEISFLNASLRGSSFFMLPREFEIYIALFIFVVLYILLRRIRFRRAVLIFLVSLGGCFIFQRLYFSITKTYIELAPVITFAFLGFMVSVLEQEYELRIHRRERKETQLARMLKEKEILPHSVLASNGALVSVTRYKIDKVGGDFYQFLEFAKGELGVALGWVPGSGVERVRHIMEIVHSWKDFASVYKEPGKVIQVLNNSLFKYAEEGKYATFIYLLYDAKKGFLKYVNAGHDPLIFVSRREGVRVISAQEPTPLGIARDIPFYEGEIDLTAIDESIFIGYSGGISRLISDSGGFKNEFLEHFKNYLAHDADKLADEIFSDFLKYYSKKPEEEWSLLTLKITE